MASRSGSAEAVAGAQPLDDVLAGVVATLIRRATDDVEQHEAEPDPDRPERGGGREQSVRRPGAAARPYAVDCGGGSGRRAVPLALHGAEVTVIDASIDALAILHRRALEAGVADHVHGTQADVEDLSELLEASSVDLVLLHNVLSDTRDPAGVVTAAARAVAVGGYLSVVVSNPAAVVIARALSGDLHGALSELTAQDDPRHRGLDLTLLTDLVRTAGFDVVSTLGLDAISSMIPGAVLEGQPGVSQSLAELDRRTSSQSPYREIAGQLHLLACRR